MQINKVIAGISELAAPPHTTSMPPTRLIHITLILKLVLSFLVKIFYIFYLLIILFTDKKYTM